MLTLNRCLPFHNFADSIALFLLRKVKSNLSYLSQQGSIVALEKQLKLRYLVRDYQKSYFWDLKALFVIEDLSFFYSFLRLNIKLKLLLPLSDITFIR